MYDRKIAFLNFNFSVAYPFIPLFFLQFQHIKDTDNNVCEEKKKIVCLHFVYVVLEKNFGYT